MLLANQSVAQHIYKHFPDMALLRRHPSPLEKRLKDVADRYGQSSLQLETDSSKAVADSIRRYQANEPDAAKVQVLQLLLTTVRCG